MDTFTFMVGAATFAFIYFGERFKAGVYLWIAMLFSVIFALRMAEPLTYMVTAGVIAVLAYRTFSDREDVRDNNEDRIE